MASANAAPPPALVIEWDAPSDCPNAEQVRGAAWAAVGSTRASRSPNVAARAVVTQAPGGGFTMQLVIETDGASETKTVAADTCATLADAYAVIVAFRLDPEAASTEPAPAPTPLQPAPLGTERPAPLGTERSAPLGTERSAPLGTERSTPVANPRVLRLGAGPVLATSAGALPFPAYGIGAAVEAEYGLRWSLGATYWPSETHSFAGGTSPFGSQAYGVAVQLVSAESSVCVPVADGVLAFCGGLEVGAISARANGLALENSKDGGSPWVSFTAGVEFELPVARFLALRIRLDAGIPTLRPTFTVNNASADAANGYQPGPVFGLLRFEPLFRFFSTDSATTRHDPR